MVAILDQFGRPFPKAAAPQRRPLASLIGSNGEPWDAASYNSAEMAGWQPYLGSPDTETTPYRDRTVARIRDLVRNDGWAAGAVTRITDAVVGADLRLSARPDYRALTRQFGGAFDAVWAKEFAAAAEGAWRSWGYDPARYCDTTRRLSVAQMFRLAFRHYLIEGEAVAVLPWRPNRMGYGRARYATTMQLVDPDRLSNPSLRPDTQFMRGGVEIDADGAPMAYHFREAHQQDWFSAGKATTWERIDRETSWGRPLVIHHFDADRAGQHRPAGGIFMPVLARIRMLAQYDRVELQAAVVNAIFGAYVQSPYDPDDVQAGMSGDEISPYQQGRADFHADRRLSAGNVRIASLYPGEEIKTISATRPVSAFAAFEAAILRNLAAATGTSYELLSQDYTSATYSSARQSMLEGWRTMGRRRADFGAGFASPVYVALQEEAFERGHLPLPKGAPDFAEARAEFTRCAWIGPGRGWIDPTKEPEGSKIKISAGLSTLERECAENDGLEWEEVLDQLALEKAAIDERGLTLEFSSNPGATLALQADDETAPQTTKKDPADA
jgi:lambda family phage portal protein